ncbi:hypothetical protein [Lacibacter sediminis]|uniref:Uncharacterized protein n=1 Tax=Lacibacter sediminis TaxID=2760713 RepID=A0A7G5XEJ0_9BACT|nr:hypothetical protein [Lacibacter sediminis]QNA43893.1 hypothetical protein H4075_17725 [Lacibacter sediminis]
MKKNQLYVLTLLFAIISLGLNSCSKEKSFSSGGSGGTGGTGGGGGTGGSGTYFMKFKLDGVQKEFSGTTSALITSFDAGGTIIHTGAFQGIQSASNTTANLMGINVNDVTALVTNKNYTDALVGITVQGVLLYFDASGDQLSSMFVTTDANVIIRLSEITTTSVSGTFSGKLASLTSGASATVTEGSFRVKRL